MLGCHAEDRLRRGGGGQTWLLDPLLLLLRLRHDRRLRRRRGDQLYSRVREGLLDWPHVGILDGVGPVSVNDVNLAVASEAVILGFNVRSDAAAETLAESEEIKIQ